MDGLAPLLQMIASLAAVVVVILGLAWMSRRLQGARAGTQAELRVCATLAVGVKERVVLVEARGQQYLLGVAPGRVNLLTPMGEAPPAFAEHLSAAVPASGDAACPVRLPSLRASFAHQFKQLLNR